MPAVAPCDESFNVSTISRSAAARTGSSPNTTATDAATAAVKASTHPSTRNGSDRLMSWKLITVLNPATIHTASSAARAAAAATSNTVSPPRSLAIRQRPAPSAMRTASSFRRPAETASSRFATFAHAMSRTKPTAQSRRGMIDREYAANRADISVALALHPGSGFGSVR